MRDVIKDAIEYANGPEHGGAGYFLNILFSDGESGTCKVYPHAGEPGYRLVNEVTDAVEFINPAHVLSVTILWA